MSRQFTMVAVVISVLPLTGAISHLRADPMRVMESRQIVGLLNEYVEMKDFQNAMSLKEVLGLLTEKFASRNKALAILVDTSAFKEEGVESSFVHESQIAFPPHPKLMRVGTFLDLTVRKLEPQSATYLIRDGLVVVTTRKAASTRRLLQSNVVAEFNNTPFSEAIEELSAITGASIVLDNRLGDKLKVPVTASLKNDVTLEAALRMLTDMADLKVVFLPAGIYVTHPFNAQNFEREMQERTRTRKADGEKEQKGTAPK
jgi:hypothetical protein